MAGYNENCPGQMSEKTLILLNARVVEWQTRQT